MKGLVIGSAEYGNPLRAVIGRDNVEHVMLKDFRVTDLIDYNDYDIVQFTGGADVSPALYNEDKHPLTMHDPARDSHEQIQYMQALDAGCVMAGICRGSQFLNVMNGGKMHQHINGHGIHGTHAMWYAGAEEPIEVTSTHHQVSILGEGGVVLGWAEGVSHEEIQEVEAFMYPETKTVAVQYHPEYMPTDSDGFKFYTGLLEKALNDWR